MACWFRIRCTSSASLATISSNGSPSHPPMCASISSSSNVDVDPGGVGVRRDGLARRGGAASSRPRAVQLHQLQARQRATLPGRRPSSDNGGSHWSPRAVADISDGIEVGAAVADQVEDAAHPAGASPAGGCRCRHSSANASMSSRSQMRPDASDVSGSGNWPRSRYVTTRRLSHAHDLGGLRDPDDPRHHLDGQRRRHRPSPCGARGRSASRVVPVTSMNAGASRMCAYQRPPVSHRRARTSSAICG